MLIRGITGWMHINVVSGVRIKGPWLGYLLYLLKAIRDLVRRRVGADVAAMVL